jgi:hypothetical protein
MRSRTSLLLTFCSALILGALGSCGDDTESPTGGSGDGADMIPPAVTITDDAPATATGDVTFTFTFSEDVGDSFAAEDVTVSGGTAGAFARASGLEATLVVTPPPQATGSIEVRVPAGSFEDASGNENTEEATAEQAFDTTTGDAFDGVVFDDDFGPGVAFEAFQDSLNDLSVDMVDPQSGTASLRIVVPDSSYTGGAFVLAPGGDVSGFDAVTFWIRSDAARTVNVAGFGNDAAESPFNTELIGGLPVGTTWAQYTVPIPNPSVLTRQTGLFHFAEGSEEGPYTLWLDEVRYVSLPAGSITNPRPSIASATEALAIDGTASVGGTSVVLAVDGSDLTLNPAAPAFFDYASSDTAVATVDGFGVITGVGEGSAEITASLDGVPATGAIQVNVGGGCAPDGANLAVNGDFETGDFSCVQQFVNGGTQSIVDDNPASGTYALRLNVVVPDNDTVVKFANLSPGDFEAGETVFISLDLRGTVMPGGVGFVELFSELEGGGTSMAEIVLGGGPILPDANPAAWTNFRGTAQVGPNTDGGISLQLKAASGAGTADLYFDNVCISKSPCP